MIHSTHFLVKAILVLGMFLFEKQHKQTNKKQKQTPSPQKTPLNNNSGSLMGVDLRLTVYQVGTLPLGHKDVLYVQMLIFNDTLNTFYLQFYIWLRTILIVRKETRYHHIGYSYQLTARVLLYAPSHRQDNTYHGLCYTSLWSTGWNEK